VGYATRRGRIIRKILTRVPAVPDFFMTAVYFLVETCIIGIILYLATLKLMLGGTVATNFIVFRLLDVIAWSFPPTFPIFFNISYSFSLTRLKWAGIFGTEPEKATEAANIRTFCFDKTGTLTQNEV
jgi:cation-transporting ATPase 13A3/4/5